MRFLALSAFLLASADPAPAIIDGHLSKAWEENGIVPAGAAGDEEFLRRLTLDVLGTIPDPGEVDSFLKDAAADKRARKVAEYVGRPEYAHHWAEHWEKVLVGYDTQAKQYSKKGLFLWLRDEVFAKNMPFDQAAQALVMARGVSTELGPVNFLLAHSRKGGGAAAMASKVSRTFLGVQIQCAQCHDHPFDRWTQEDFHGMTAFFARVANRKVDPKDQKDARFELYDNPKGEASVGEGKQKRTVPPQFLDGSRPGEGKGRRDEFARFMLQGEPSQFARALVNRYWSHFFGRGFVNPVDDFSGKSKPSHPALLDALATEFTARKSDVAWLVRTIAGSQAYQRTSAKPKSPAPERFFSYALTRPLAPEQLNAAVQKALGAPPAAKDENPKLAQQRDGALGQFRKLFGDDEQQDTAVFDGTIPQALLLMNASIVNQQVSSKSGRLAAILREHEAPADRIAQIFLAVVSRHPRGTEAARYAGHVREAGGGPAAYEDVCWVLLNSSEFLFNH